MPNLISRHGYDSYLDFLVTQNHNFIRLWMVEHAWDEKEKSRIGPHPWMRTGPGNALDGLPRFDLNRPDPTFYDRLRQRVIAARDRGIYVSVMLFGGMWGTEHPSTWKGHPFNRENNVNGIDGDADRDGLGNEIYTLKIPAVVAIQKAHVRKTIDTLNDLDNVLFEIANEVRAYSTGWQYELIKTVKDYEATKPKRHPVGMTGYDSIPDRDLMESPADWISPSNSGGDYKGSPPPSSGRKVIVIDTDHLWGEGGNPAWVWKSFTRGLNPIWMDRIKMGEGDLPHADAIRAAMSQSRSFAQRMDLAAMTPRGDLASTGYCLAHPGKEYIVYLPDGGEVTVDLSAASHLMTAEWFDAHVGKTVDRSTVHGGGTRKFRAPFEGDAVLHICSGRPSGWWSAKGLRIATYEFLEEMKGGAELSVEEILEQIRRLGGVDVLLC